MENEVKQKRNLVRDVVRENTLRESEERLSELTKTMENEGYTVSFGLIGKKSTYCLLQKGEEEIVGYTFIRNVKYYSEVAGRLKALQQAVARKETLETSE